MATHIIRPWFFQLGDQLQWSWAPQRLSELGHDVWLSHECKCSQWVYDLVWGLNPYLKGISKDKANFGELPGFEYKNVCDNFLKNWQIITGIDPQDDYPIIYYQPKLISELQDTILIDMNCSSRKDDYSFDVLNDYLSVYRDNPRAFSIKFKSFDQGDTLYGFPTTECNSIYHYCDMIHSCKKFVCLNSGGNSLASSLKRNKNIDVDCLVTHTPTFESMYARKNFFYPNINYVWL
jgi:hypothetical protein